MGNCWPYQIFGYKFTDKNVIFKNLYSEKDNLSNYIDSPDDFILYGTLKYRSSKDYFSPNCTKRPFEALRRCDNCKSIFYAYKIEQFCSRNCRHSSLSYIDILDKGYNSN